MKMEHFTSFNYHLVTVFPLLPPVFQEKEQVVPLIFLETTFYLLIVPVFLLTFNMNLVLLAASHSLMAPIHLQFISTFPYHPQPHSLLR